MPEYTALAIGCRGVRGRGNRLFYGEILMIAGKNFELLRPFIGEADEVFQDIQKAFLLENSVEEGIKLRIR